MKAKRKQTVLNFIGRPDPLPQMKCKRCGVKMAAPNAKRKTFICIACGGDPLKLGHLAKED
jgi:hypothetical protein